MYKYLDFIFLIIIFVNRQGNIIISDISYKNEKCDKMWYK